MIADDDIESKMEVLTNALALIASSGCTPMVDENDENLQFWLEEAEAMLLRDDEAVDSMFSDLASNLGCIRILTDPTKSAAEGSDESWLEEAADTDEAAKGTPEQTNLQWSKHFWYKDIEDVSYEVPTSKVSNTNKLSVTESVTQVNQSLLDENLSHLPAQPHAKWNLLQIRMYWYDRSILQLKAGKYVECQDSCQSLKKTLSSSVSASKGGDKKKNKETTQGTNSSQSPQAMWWEARADVVLAYAQQGLSKHNDASARLNDGLDALKAAPSSVVVDHAMTHVLLHQFVMEQQQQKGTKKDRQKLLALLKSLPESIQSRPAAQLTIDDLQEAVNNSSNNKTKSAPKSPLEEADMLFGEGRYEEACKLYESALSGADDSSMDSQLRYVQALAMSGLHEASRDLWQSLESTVLDETSLTTAPLPDGSALENKALPRTVTTSARSTLSNKLASNANDEDDENKPSREKILRRRAVQREAYLKELESKGNYNPDRPTKPDPERWIPKNERSRSSKNRNRGGGRNNNKGVNSAQGGGSKLDAERLDAAARRAGKTQASSGPSSASLRVSSGGRKGGRRR
uniref:Signal recognition particle subunit SRP72 n=1 Tax=Pseudo-nitzschia delicatissima TaxID=44447 RepID=A0A7S0UGC6_9STRA